MNKSEGKMRVVTILELLLLLFMLISCSQQDNKQNIKKVEIKQSINEAPAPAVFESDKITQSSKMKDQPAEQFSVPEFKVLKKDVYDAPIKTQIELNILVYGKISEDGLKQLLNNLYIIYSQEHGFKYHDIPTHIAIFAYTSNELFEAEMGQWIARLLKTSENGQPQIDIKSFQVNQLSIKPEDYFRSQ